MVANFNKQKPFWGGPWTEKKLQAFENYVKAYLKIMNNHHYWQTIYFDGFAGSGDKGGDQNPLYTTLKFSEDEELVYKGAAERICCLEEPNRFDFYCFIEKDETSINSLKGKIQKLNESKPGKQEYRAGNCNGELIKLAKALHETKSNQSIAKKFAALILLDPFGMQVEWNSISQLAGTKSDVWILLPTAVIVNRLLDKKGELKYINKLESFFGLNESQIKDHFYLNTGQQNLFENTTDHYLKIADPIKKIAKLYIDKMKGIWTHVTEEPLRLDNTKGAPLFHFVFASNNKSAYNIAKDIIKNV